LPVGVREIRVPHDVDAFGPMGADDVEDGLAVDDGHIEVHGPGRPYSSCAVHVGSKTVSRYGVPRSAHTNNTVGGGRLGLPPPPPPPLLSYCFSPPHTPPPGAPPKKAGRCGSPPPPATGSPSGIRAPTPKLACDSKG